MNDERAGNRAKIKKYLNKG